MKKVRLLFALLCVFMLFSIQFVWADEPYVNFKTAVYARVYEVQKMQDKKWLESTFQQMNEHLHIDKIYLETHRDMVVIDEDELVKMIKFFKKRGVQTSGGITVTVNERNLFETYCYTNPEHRAKLKEVVELTARHFDELILDDFFFTSCKCDSCIKAKGDKSWTRFRLDLMEEAARELILEPARAVNPEITVIIKYPNWYEHFQGLGFDLEREPLLFDKIYTGTETRDGVYSNQHLQQYQGYQIFRYFENIAPGRNGGGWVDTYGSRTADRYAEQLWLTLLAKAPEITMFDYRQMTWPLPKQWRADWQGEGTSFDYDAMVQPYLKGDSLSAEATMALAAGTALKQIDEALGFLGNPVGLKSYKPYHSTGEDFLHNYLGMVGIPMDLYPQFPAQADMILLTESAKFDSSIVSKIKRQLSEGQNVVITSGFLRALQEKGLDDIMELQYTNRKSLVKQFLLGRSTLVSAPEEMLIPQIQYLTNDSWEFISGLDGGIGWPVLHRAQYSKGYLFVLTIPDNFADLYNMPVEVLNAIRAVLVGNQFVRMEGPGQIALFLYDNQTAVVHSFKDEPVTIRLIINKDYNNLVDLFSTQLIEGEAVDDGWDGETGEKAFNVELKPHSYRVFQIN